MYARGGGPQYPWNAYGESSSKDGGRLGGAPGALHEAAGSSRGPDTGSGYLASMGHWEPSGASLDSIGLRQHKPGFPDRPHSQLGQRMQRVDDPVERQLDECLEGLFGRSTGSQQSPTNGAGGGGSGGFLHGVQPVASFSSSQGSGSQVALGRPSPAAQAAAVRHIAEWLRNTPGGASAEARRARLRTEHAELTKEHHSERVAAEELQVRLSSEMRELKDQCHEQGQTVGMLAQRLSDARNAVTAELRGAAEVHSTLDSELMSEESQRRALEAARRGEEAELSHRVEAAEQQLATMTGTRASLEAQLQASTRVQTELREHIEAERGGRSELEVAGQRELQAWSEHNVRVCNELESRLQSERAEMDAWRTSTTEEVERLKQESSQHSLEEGQLVEQLESVREWQAQARRRLRTEVLSWSREVEVLRERAQEADEEHWKSEDALRRHELSQGACGDERKLLEEEFEDRLSQAGTANGELQNLQMLSKSMADRLQDLRRQVRHYKEDVESERLMHERDTLVDEVSREVQRHRYLQEEIEAERNSWSAFLCGRRRQVPNSPPESPRTTPFRGPQSETLRAQFASSRHAADRDRQGADASRANRLEGENPQAQAYPVGSLIETMDPAKMRRGEDLESDSLGEVPPGHRCIVLQVGHGRRLQVRTASTGDVGWISSATKGGLRLIRLVSEDGAGYQQRKASGSQGVRFAGRQQQQDPDVDCDEV